MSDVKNAADNDDAKIKIFELQNRSLTKIASLGIYALLAICILQMIFLLFVFTWLPYPNLSYNNIQPMTHPVADEVKKGDVKTNNDIAVVEDQSGKVYAFDKKFNHWYSLNAQGEPEQVTDVPEHVQTKINGSAVNNTELASNDADEKFPLVNTLLDKADIAEKFMAGLSKATGIETDGLRNGQYPIFAFFDPRCPYCHNAFSELNTKYAVKWLPTLALGNGGEGAINEILGNISITKDTNGVAIISNLNQQAQVLKLQNIMSGHSFNDAQLTEAQNFVVNENMSLLKVLYGKQEHLLGVPSFLIPRGDGTALFLRGYDNKTITIISDVFSGKKGN